MAILYVVVSIADEGSMYAPGHRLFRRSWQYFHNLQGAARPVRQAGQFRFGQANVLMGLGELERKLGRNDKAREAYAVARTLYEAVGNRLGQANVLMGLGELERKLGRNDKAREAYAVARTLYEAVGNRLGQANVLMGLGELERKLDRNNQAKKNFDQAAYMYEALGMEESKELAVKFSKDLGDQDK